MPQPIPLSEERAQEVARVARGIIAGAIGIVEGARKMADVHLYSGHAAQPRDEDYALFLEIDGGTSHLPVGEARKHWSADALVRKDAEAKEVEACFRERALSSALAIDRRYGKRPNQPPEPTRPSGPSGSS